MTTAPYDLATPRRPTLDDVGGAAKINDPGAPAPDPVLMLTADDVNIGETLLQRLCALAPVAVLYVTVPGGVATKTTVIGMPDGSNAPTEGNLASAFTIDHPDDGMFVITVAAGVLPPAALPPRARAVYDGSGDGSTREAQCKTVGAEIRVQTFRGDTGVMVDCAFVLEIY